ncbi:MAG TPA: hypothetical protein VNO17_08070 [Actinomycetota bacterium]|jgi:hypothetical protein|nr:hypothetical protein [Actinomycetota bacterium]
MTGGQFEGDDRDPFDEEADLRRPGWVRWAALGLAVLLLVWAALTVLGR